MSFRRKRPGLNSARRRCRGLLGAELRYEGSECFRVQVFSSMSRSSPRPNTSSRFGAHDATAGGAVKRPPSQVQPSCEDIH
jgi:hypothetical protein